MKVFLSWSGERSRAIGETLRETLPLFMNAVTPWMSELDIDKGDRWNTVISEVLDISKVGIFCVTPANVSKPAILFEAGAISKSVSNARVCVLLEGMAPSDLIWPWSQFQTTRLNDQKDMFKMLTDMNRWLTEAGEPALPGDQFSRQLDMWWPEFQRQLKEKPGEVTAPVPHRSEKDMLIEVLDLLRSQKRESLMLEIMLAQQERTAEDEVLRIAKARERREVLRMRLLDAMSVALGTMGHGAAANEILHSRLIIRGNGVLLVRLRGEMRESMAKLTFNEDAKRIMLDAVRKLQNGITDIEIVGGGLSEKPAPPRTLLTS